MKSAVRLSQCVIVKNEEKNIRRALSWGRNIAFEQIVVDTGSTDHTVQIAEEIGALVYHFPWINDFSAAKNFAIEQAKGQWIAFLDADEYFSAEDAEKLINLISRLERNFTPSKRPHIVRTSLVNLNDKGEAGSVGTQDKIFRNIPGLRYRNRIHETLWGAEHIRIAAYDAAKQLCIFHTGYTAEAYSETGKRERNLLLLEQTVAEEPDQVIAWSYLGDAYLAYERLDDAQKAYEKALKNSKLLGQLRREIALCGLLKIQYYKKTTQIEEILLLYQNSQKEGCESPDAEYWAGLWMLRSGRLKEGISYLKAALEKLDHYSAGGVLDAAGSLSDIYQSIYAASMELNNPGDAVKYGVLALRLNPYLDQVLQGILSLFKKEPGEMDTAAATFQFLSKLYQFNALKDKLFVIKVSRIAAFPALEDSVYSLLSDEEKDFFNQKQKSPYYVSREEQRRLYPELSCCNETDQSFLNLIREAQMRTEAELLSQLEDRLTLLNKENAGAGDEYLQSFLRYPLWTSEAISKRIAYIQSEAEELVSLYCRLADYQSKKVLLSILRNWLFLDQTGLKDVKRSKADFYDLDLISDSTDRVFVDAGAYDGDTSTAYINAYGENYKRIYCYEPSSETARLLQRNMRKYDNIIIRQAALGSAEKSMELFAPVDAPSLAYLTETGSGITVPVVTLDGDIQEKIDYLKIDINGSEKKALLGGQRHIREGCPALEIALYHDIADLTNIPRIILELNQSYKLYLRYFGGDLVPMEFFLYAL